jgi:adenosine deaminase
LVFYRNIPNEKVVLDFIDKVRGQVKIYLKEKYTTFDIATSEQDFYNRLNWLRDREVINSAEYAEYKANFDTQKLI